MKPVVGWYVPFPLMATPAPICVPPVLQFVGAVDTGPKTVKLMVPVAPEPELDAITELMVLAERATPTVPVAGAEAETDGLALITMVEAIPDPQVELAALLFASDGEETYHQ